MRPARGPIENAERSKVNDALAEVRRKREQRALRDNSENKENQPVLMKGGDLSKGKMDNSAEGEAPPRRLGELSVNKFANGKDYHLN